LEEDIRSIRKPSYLENNQFLVQTYQVDSKDGEIRGFKLVVEGEKAGELVIKLQNIQKTLQIQLLLVERKYRERGFGTELLKSAEKIAAIAQLSKIVLRPYSLENFYIKDFELRRWYASRGYKFSQGMMYRDIREEATAVIA